LERLFDTYLKIGPLVRHPLAATHFADREGRSTETALHHLVCRVERQLEIKECATGAFLDIEGAFDSTSIDTIKQAMNRHDVPEALVDWIENMLAGRRIVVYHGVTVVEGTPDRGCPQGGVLSPLLWCLVVNDLFEDLQREGFHVCRYADDIAIVVGGRFLSTLRDLMEYALKIINRWCKNKGLVVNPQKTNIMIFTKKYKPETIEPLRFEGQEISFTDTVKYLGVLLETKLNRKQHLIDKRKKFYSSMWVCRRARGKTWGINPKVALWMYKAILLPKLLYAASLVAHAKQGGDKEPAVKPRVI
jgi:hypothetical protein